MSKLTPKFRPLHWRQSHAQPLPGTRASEGAGPVAGDASAAAAVVAVIIPDRGEFIDALRRLRRGHVLVRPRAAREDESVRCMLDSGIVYTAFDPLLRYGLISEYRNPEGFPNMRYYRLTISGRSFAERACQAWRQWPLPHRLAVRICG